MDAVLTPRLGWPALPTRSATVDARLRPVVEPSRAAWTRATVEAWAADMAVALVRRRRREMDGARPSDGSLVGRGGFTRIDLDGGRCSSSAGPCATPEPAAATRRNWQGGARLGRRASPDWRWRSPRSYNRVAGGHRRPRERPAGTIRREGSTRAGPRRTRTPPSRCTALNPGRAGPAKHEPRASRRYGSEGDAYSR